MKRLLSSFFVLFAVVGSIVAGMPLHAGMMDSKMMKCCKRAKGHEQSPSAEAARLCCAVNCSDPAPTSSVSSFNFSPTGLSVTDSLRRQLSELLEKRGRLAPILLTFDVGPAVKSSPPKFIQHHSFLI